MANVPTIPPHMLLPAPRKVAMPLSADMPAPVRTTMRCALLSSSAAVVTEL